MSAPVTWGDVVGARQRLTGLAHRTPTHTSRLLDAASGARVFLKCENLQRTGSFKFRGACSAVTALTPEQRARGVVADSSGNHAQALALAAQLHGAPATIVMPEGAVPAKVEATRRYGATVVFCAPTHKARHDVARRLVRDTGATYVSPHDDPLVVAGQASAACELLEDVADLDAILAPVGGGGLLSGTLLAARHLAKKVRVIGCEPAGADDAARSLRSGERVTEFEPRTIADGLRTPLGEIPFAILRREALDDIALVEEDEITTAMRFVWERTKLVIEPSAAVAVAPLLADASGLEGKRIGVIVSGGNVDLGLFFASQKGEP